MNNDIKFPQVAEQGNVLGHADEVLKLLKKATKVVGWYAHAEDYTVRGPFCRWFKVTDVLPQYEKSVGSKFDDVRYASACMNYAPILALEVQRLTALLTDRKGGA